MAWIRVARPTMGQFVVAKAWSKLNLFMLKSTGVMVSFAALYMSALMLGFPLLSAHILGEKYSHVADLLLLWGVYFMVNGARNVGTTALISFGVFRVLFWQGLVSAAILALVCFVVIPKYSVHGALGAMIFVEFFELMINWFFLLPKAKQGQFVTV
jgi:O-antigen/teichoic acid export membrane protein